jgi:hypothetical protein
MLLMDEPTLRCDRRGYRSNVTVSTLLLQTRAHMLNVRAYNPSDFTIDPDTEPLGRSDGGERRLGIGEGRSVRRHHVRVYRLPPIACQTITTATAHRM